MADAQTIDKLAVEITTSIKGESKLKRFSDALSQLATTSQSINTSNLAQTATHLKSFSSALSGINTNGVKNFANAINRLSSINGNMTGLDNLSKSIINLTNSATNTDGITRLANALNRLARADMSKFNSSGLSQISSTIQTLVGSLAGAEKVDAGITRLVTAFAKLADSGKYIGNVTTELPKIGTALTSLVSGLANIGTVDANISRLVEGIAKLTSAGKKAAETTANLDRFGDAVVRLVRKLQGVGGINTNLANTIQGLGNLASSGQKFTAFAAQANVSTTNLGGSFSRLGSIVWRTINPFNSFAEKLGHTKKQSKGLASAIGKLYAGYFMLFRGIRGIGSAAGSAQDYVEAFNYFNVAMQRIGDDSKDQYKRFGWESAEAYAESFQDRFTQLQKTMTGYDVNSRTGDLEYTGGRNLGLNIKDVMQYQAQVAQISNSVGQLGEVSIMASKAMSMVAADLSSLTNTDLVQVQENLVSGFNGMTRAVYKYGINITQANLQQIAYNHGVQTSVAKLSMAAKQQLRLIGILEQSKVAWGDLNRTLNQPANMLRRLQAGFANLGRTIGSLFLPLLNMVYPVLNAIVSVLQQFFGWIAKLLGVKMPDMSSALKMPEDIGGASDDMGDLSDNTGKAAKNAKKLTDNIQGFDEINKLDKLDDASGGGGSGGGGGGLGDIDLSDDIKSLLDQLNDAWAKKYEDKVATIAERIKNALLRGWNRGGDFKDLGISFGKWITNGLKKINWSKIKEVCTKLVRSIATFLNGAIEGADWKVIGETFAEGLNTVVDMAYTWWSTFDWLAFGKRLATGLNAAINKFDWAKFGKLLGTRLRGMIQLAFGFITEFDFTNLGDKIATAINNFLADMGKIDPRTGLSGWSELGKTISDAIKGILDTIITVLDKADWDAIGNAIADFFGNIDWIGIFQRVGQVIVKALGGAIKAAITAFKKDPWGMATALASVLGIVFAYKKLIGFFDGFRLMFARGMEGSLLRAMNGIGKGNAFASASGGIFSRIKNMFSKLFNGSGGGLFSSLFSGATTGASAGFFSKIFSGFGGSAMAGGVASSTSLAVQNGLTSGLSAVDVNKAFMASGLGGSGGKIASLVGKGGLIAAAFAATAGTGLAIGKLINWNIDEETEAHEAYSKAGHFQGKSLSKKYIDTSNNIKNRVGGDHSIGNMNYDELKKNYTMLAKKTHRTAIETKTMKTYAKQLKQVYPELAESLDKGVSSFSKAEQSAKRHANILEANEKAAEEFAKKGTLEKAYQDSKKNLDAMEKEYADLVRERDEAKVRLSKGLISEDEFNKINAKVGEYALSLMNVRAAHEQTKQAVDDNRVAIEKYNNLLELGKVSDEEYGKTTDILREKMRKLGVPIDEAKYDIKRLQKMVDNGTLSWKDYKNICKGSYDNQAQLNSAIADAIFNTERFKTAENYLKESMQNANVPQDKQREILKKLKDALAEGRISMKQYEDIVKSCGGNVDLLGKKIKEIPANKNVKISFKAGSIKDVLARIKQIPKTVEVGVTFNGQTSGNLNAQNQSRWMAEQVFKAKGRQGAELTALMKQISIDKKGVVTFKNKSDYKQYADLLKKKGLKVKVAKHAQGGIIEDGLFTMNHHELAGRFTNGKSVVANNQQITEGFAQGITKTLAPAIYSAVKQAMNETSTDSNGNVNVYLDGKQIAENSVKHIQRMNRGTGKSVFA